MYESSGLMESLKRMAGTLLVIISLFLFGLSAILLTALVVAVVWDNYRMLELAGFNGVHFVAGFMAGRALRPAAMEKSKLCSASLAKLADDRYQIAPLP